MPKVCRRIGDTQSQKTEHGRERKDIFCDTESILEARPHLTPTTRQRRRTGLFSLSLIFLQMSRLTLRKKLVTSPNSQSKVAERDELLIQHAEIFFWNPTTYGII